jgi:hypothetical protein
MTDTTVIRLAEGLLRKKATLLSESVDLRVL